MLVLYDINMRHTISGFTRHSQEHEVVSENTLEVLLALCKRTDGQVVRGGRGGGSRGGKGKYTVIAQGALRMLTVQPLSSQDPVFLRRRFPGCRRSVHGSFDGLFSLLPV